MVDLFDFKVPSKDREIFSSLVDKMGKGYDFRDPEKFEELSKEEQCMYIGYTLGVNNIIAMAEENLGNRSAGILNMLFNENIFEWNADGSELMELEPQEMTDVAIEELKNNKN